MPPQNPNQAKPDIKSKPTLGLPETQTTPPVLLLTNNKFYSWMGDHAFLSAAQEFEEHVSLRLRTIFSDSDPTTALSTGKVSISWLRRCLAMMPYANRAFARLVAIIDHPISTWGPDTAEEYLSYTFNLLDHLNRMSYAISLLGLSRVSLAHALTISESSPSVVAVKRLKGITAHASGKYIRNVGGRGEDVRGRTVTGKDWAIHNALNIMKGIESWVSGVVISALSGDASPYLEMRSVAVRFIGPSMADLDKKLHEGIVLEEVMEINESVALMAKDGDGKSRGDDAQVLLGRLDEIEKSTEGLRKEVDCIFSEVLLSRNALLDCLRASHFQM